MNKTWAARIEVSHVRMTDRRDRSGATKERERQQKRYDKARTKSRHVTLDVLAILNDERNSVHHIHYLIGNS